MRKPRNLNELSEDAKVRFTQKLMGRLVDLLEEQNMIGSGNGYNLYDAIQEAVAKEASKPAINPS